MNKDRRGLLQTRYATYKATIPIYDRHHDTVVLVKNFVRRENGPMLFTKWHPASETHVGGIGRILTLIGDVILCRLRPQLEGDISPSISPYM